MSIRYPGNKVRRLCAVIVGLVFFVAGILKLMDPVGSMLIVREYFSFLHLGFFRPAAGVVAEGFAFLETFLGVCLVTGVARKTAAWASTVVMAGFTLLTLLLWILNPQMDCGCFGEAVHLTHFQSFLKNVVLCVLILAAFLPYKEFGKPKKSKYVTFALTGAVVIFFAIYSLMFIPMLELTPFNLSSKLEAAAGIPDSGEEEYISTFVYEKNGKTGVFTLNNLPDSTWTFVETRTVRKQDHIKESSYPRLSFTDSTGEYRDTLAADGLVMTISVPEPARMKPKNWDNAARVLSDAAEAGFVPLLLVAGTPDSFASEIAHAGLERDKSMLLLTSVYYSDYKTLISLNRSNGGAVYFNDGNIIRKWAGRSLPSSRRLAKLVRMDSTEVMLDADGKGRLYFEAFMLYSFVLMLIL